MPSALKIFISTGVAVASFGLSSCGYNLRGDNRAFFEVHHIRTLYVAPAKNNSYKAGAEINIYNALRKRIALGGYVRLVDNPDVADAVMNEVVVEAGYAPVGITTADQLTSAPIVVSGPNGNPTIVSPFSGPSNVQVASICAAKLRVHFVLNDNKGRGLWAEDFSRYENFTNSTYIGAQGNTSGLINASEFERALSDLSTTIVTDAEESLNSIL